MYKAIFLPPKAGLHEDGNADERRGGDVMQSVSQWQTGARSMALAWAVAPNGDERLSH